MAEEQACLSQEYHGQEPSQSLESTIRCSLREQPLVAEESCWRKGSSCLDGTLPLAISTPHRPGPDTLRSLRPATAVKRQRSLFGCFLYDYAFQGPKLVKKACCTGNKCSKALRYTQTHLFSNLNWLSCFSTSTKGVKTFPLGWPPEILLSVAPDGFQISLKFCCPH